MLFVPDYSFWTCVLVHGVRNAKTMRAIALTCRAGASAVATVRDRMVSQFFTQMILHSGGLGWQSVLNTGTQALLHGTFGRLLDCGTHDNGSDVNWATYKVSEFRFGYQSGPGYYVDLFDDSSMKHVQLEPSILNKVREVVQWKEKTRLRRKIAQ